MIDIELIWRAELNIDGYSYKCTDGLVSISTKTTRYLLVQKHKNRSYAIGTLYGMTNIIYTYGGL